MQYIAPDHGMGVSMQVLTPVVPQYAGRIRRTRSVIADTLVACITKPWAATVLAL